MQLLRATAIESPAAKLVESWKRGSIPHEEASQEGFRVGIADTPGGSYRNPSSRPDSGTSKQAASALPLREANGSIHWPPASRIEKETPVAETAKRAAGMPVGRHARLRNRGEEKTRTAPWLLRSSRKRQDRRQ